MAVPIVDPSAPPTEGAAGRDRIASLPAGGPSRPGPPPQAAALAPAGAPRGRRAPARRPLRPPLLEGAESPAADRAAVIVLIDRSASMGAGAREDSVGPGQGESPEDHRRASGRNGAPLAYFRREWVAPRLPATWTERLRQPRGHGLSAGCSAWARDLVLAAGKTAVRGVPGERPSASPESAVRSTNPSRKARRSRSWTSAVRSFATWPSRTSRPSKRSSARDLPSPSRHGSSNGSPFPRARSACSSLWMASRPLEQTIDLEPHCAAGRAISATARNDRASITGPSASSERTTFRPTIVAGSPSRRGARPDPAG